MSDLKWLVQMGIDKLTSALEKDELFVHTNLTGSKIGIDGASLLQYLHLQLKEPDDYEQLDLFAAVWIEQIRRNEISPIVLFEETVEVEDFKLKTLQEK